jgi:hypothetical protein
MPDLAGTFCPFCGAPGKSRTLRSEGDGGSYDTCERGHHYAPADAVDEAHRPKAEEERPLDWGVL